MGLVQAPYGTKTESGICLEKHARLTRLKARLASLAFSFTLYPYTIHG